MFLNSAALIKQMRVAYSGNGITFADKEDGLVINASVWFVWIHNSHVSNKIKAVVMELAGVLPERGSIFTVSKQNPTPQYRIDGDTNSWILGVISNCKEPLKVTPVCLFEDKEVRLLQDTRLCQMHGINNLFFNIIDKTQVDLEIESEPIGPGYYKQVKTGICWYNEICKFMIMPFYSKRKEVLESLSTVKFD